MASAARPIGPDLIARLRGAEFAPAALQRMSNPVMNLSAPPVSSIAAPRQPVRVSAESSSVRPRWELAVWLVALLFFGLSTTASWLRWVNFQYRTFDLAYYVQALWQLVHGRLQVTVESVPLLGNHVEPIVFLIAPLFAVIRHPMLLVVLQNAALAALGPIGYLVIRRTFETRSAALLSMSLLITPATGYVALHEFHPEAFSAPLLLLLIYARSVRRLGLHWLACAGVLACKENMAVVLAVYCGVFLVVDRRGGATALLRWYGLPMVIAIVWFGLCVKVITPALNSGQIDYLSLYDRLGRNGFGIIRNAFTQPQLIGQALGRSLAAGNLLWALLIPFLGLPLLRPRWLLIACPVLLQHLLSWRSSEWTIYFHYAAPLLPLFWIGAVEGLATLHRVMEGRGHQAGVRPNEFGGAGVSRFTGSASGRLIRILSAMILAACLTAQFWIGPMISVYSEVLHQSVHQTDRARKQAVLDKIPANASVVAPLPYLSHLAMREKLYSLHYILKGLKTLSRQQYELPPVPDVAFVDYDDSATFDAAAGYYHPQMRTVDGQVIPSSDELLHRFLIQARWRVESRDELALFFRDGSGQNSPSAASAADTSGGIVRLTTPGSELRDVSPLAITGRSGAAEMRLRWSVQDGRDIFPWMFVRLNGAGNAINKTITKGWCAIDVASGLIDESWSFRASDLPSGTYQVEAVLVDNSKRAWAIAHGQKNDAQSSLLSPPVPLGTLTVPGPDL